MGRKDPSHANGDRVKSILRHIDNVQYAASQCPFHFNMPCFILLNNFNEKRFHCLYANNATVWKSYSVTKSCDVPEHFYDMIELKTMLGREYVLPFAGHFRESSGYTIGMFRFDVDLYPPPKIERVAFKETAYAMIVFLCAVCRRMGGVTPSMKYFSFVYTSNHPVLCDIGIQNTNIRERLVHREEHFNEKKWTRFMRHKTIRDVVRYLRIQFPLYFQKKKKGMRCILDETEACFDGETHRLICRSDKSSLEKLLVDFCHLMPNVHVRRNVIEPWLRDLKAEKTSNWFETPLCLNPE